MKAKIQEILKKSRANFTDIRLEKVFSTLINYKGKELDSISTFNESGGIIRCNVNGGWGISTFNEIDEIEASQKKAFESAKLIASKIPKSKQTKLIKYDPINEDIFAKQDGDIRKISLAKKNEVVKNYNEIILAKNSKIVSTNVKYIDRFSEYYYANSEGTFIFEERPDISLHLIATAKKADTIETALGGKATKLGFNKILGLEKEAHEVAVRAASLLDAEPILGGTYDVVLDQVLAGTFVHEAFGHLSEADFVYENKNLKEIMVLGKKFGPDFLDIIDNGDYKNLRATHKYDDEGIKTKKTYLVKNGVLEGRLHSRETASIMKEEPTGNARAISYQYEPIVRMTNTYIDKKDASFDDLIRSTKKGIYARNFFGGQTAFEHFSFSAAYGFLIENGKITKPLRDIVLSGNLFTTLNNIEMIGNDLSFIELGGCGKGEQVGLPATTGSPHIKIKNVMVGGR